jgi:hypothetical protein
MRHPRGGSAKRHENATGRAPYDDTKGHTKGIVTLDHPNRV